MAPDARAHRGLGFLRYVEPVFRPPSEAESYILQITYGCTHNECTFCGMYREKPFKLRPEAEVFEDIRLAARQDPGIRRVFLADGDAMILKTAKLIRVLDELALAFPALERVAIYSDARGILLKSDEELRELQRRNLGIVYLGLESGSDTVLREIKKGSTAGEMTQAIQRAEAADIRTSVIALLGIAGKAGSAEHALETARVVSEMSPTYFSALTLTLVPGTPLAESAARGEFEPLTPEESLEELGRMIAAINSPRPVIFRTNHASNYVPLKGVLPENREQILNTLTHALRTGRLKPEWMRGL